MTTQEAYEGMRAYLTRPGAVRAVVNIPGFTSAYCAYEADMGDKGTHRCAVGCLLTPGTINKLRRHNSLTGCSAERLLADFGPKELQGVDQRFLVAAQITHDNADNWEGGTFEVEHLDKLADEHGLDVVVDEPVGTPQIERELVLA